MIKQKTIAPLLLCLMGCATIPHPSAVSSLKLEDRYKNSVDSVLHLMTLEEKIGQMNQYSSDFDVTGPSQKDSTKLQQIRNGRVGSMLNVKGAENTRLFQEIALQSRLHIPLLFGLDVIHGMRTVYPIPLGEAASFDLTMMEQTAAAAAKEASSEGIHWTFAPMVDVARDARWGRVMEGAGEDTWYGCKVAQARVHGFQGRSLADSTSIMACAKHFAAYGACIGGKDYNTVDISPLTLHEVYLPPFKAAVDAGVGSFMNAFNEINGIPSTAQTHIQRELLKGKWGFNGLTVSDWNSVGEMVEHGFVENLKGAAHKAILGGCDIDMESRAYTTHLEELVKKGVVPITYIDDAVRRILLKKFQLGLFKNPFKNCNTEREKRTVLSSELKAIARQAGSKSVVLLKNESHALPLVASQKIAVIGALANSKKDMIGSWAVEGIESEVVTVLEGMQHKFPHSCVTFAEGYELDTNKPKYSEALQAADQADVVIVAVGERAYQSGEARSMAHIDVPATQQQLIKDLKDKGKKVVVLVMGGRPLIFNELTPYADAILMTWWLGTEAGNAIADVLAGDYNPSGKLPMTFPATIGQVPMYYNYKNTGRPQKSGFMTYTSGYLDQDFQPAYPFGFGLSYTQFELSAPLMEKHEFSMQEKVVCKVKVKNIGTCKGKETVQLYIRDLVASVTRPIKELRGFEQVTLEPNEAREVTFTLEPKDFAFRTEALEYNIEPGMFEIMIGNSSANLKKTKIELK